MNFKKLITFLIISIFLSSNCLNVLGSQLQTEKNKIFKTTNFATTTFELKFNFSIPEVVPYNNYSVVRVNETNHNPFEYFNYDPGKPVLPVNLSMFNLKFGSKIISLDYEYSTPEIMNLSFPLIFCGASYDNGVNINFISMDLSIYKSEDIYPKNWVSYHTGGGLFYGERTTFLVLKVYPVRYIPGDNQIEFIRNITVSITYQQPIEPIIQPEYKRDLLIIAPQNFIKYLEPLVNFKSEHNIKTELYSLQDIYSIMSNSLNGRDEQEQIKYFIKEAIEKWDITYVLLVGGREGQTNTWNFPVRYSHVIPSDEQEYPEQYFISDLYYADIFDGEGNFSSWDSNFDDIFAVWNETFKEDMDSYPDVYLGRLPCRNIPEVRVMVNKIIEYEQKPCDKEWFNNLLLVGGDSYINTGQWPEDVVVNEGELACEAAIDVMPGFNPLKVYATFDDINRETVNEAFNQGAGFAYFCGHGNPASWGTHFEPANSSNWVSGYQLQDMVNLKNREKQPITVVGGCHNAQFDVTMWNILLGIREEGFKYFSLKKGKVGQFWYNEWVPNCWAWWLTSKPNGGAIATIANTGLGTHGDGDQNNNGIVDYLEVLDGWLELRFLELYGIENNEILGLNHGQTITEYLNLFLDDDSKMDVKMVQQWELFGDPSLKIGGYS
ncbi:MAG: C25 family cysteine peptidase [Candidatus Thermoplasmatota archaeon]|nr:C25 family cysteine peptidase [Candidatus Thermoplasmatota archaeon]